MSYQKLTRVIVRLKEKTDEGKIEWEATANDNIFIASFPDQSIRIEKVNQSSIHDGFLAAVTATKYVITILDSAGKEIESTNDAQMTNQIQNSTYFFMTLFNAAKRYACGIDSALDKLLNALGDDDIPF